jgi:hypothetical protein
VGMVGATGLDPAKPTVGNTLIVGTVAGELTPRLPISMEPNGIPVRAAPPGVAGDVDVGVDDEAMLLEPEPHIPDMPEVSSIPEVVDIPDVAEIPDDVDIPVEVDISDIAAVAGAAVPTAIPPPSKLELDPNIPDGEAPRVEQVALLPGIEIVPVTMGAGLTPGDAISVEPRGIPVGETVEPVPKPSGEVASMVGVGLAIPLTCAMAALQTISAGITTATSENLTGTLRSQRSRLVRGYRASVNPQWRRMRLREGLYALERKREIASFKIASFMPRPVQFSWPEGGRLARPVQLNTRLLSWPGIQLRDLKSSPFAFGS